MPQPTIPKMDPVVAKPPVPSTVSNAGTSGYFADPILQGYLDFGKQTMSKLSQPQAINPTLQAAIDALTKMSSGGGPHIDTSFLNDYRNQVGARTAELRKPGYTENQQALLRTNVSDPIEQARDAARQQVMEHMSARGIAPGSGIMEQALIDSDRSFQQQRTTGERDLATNLMAQDEARKGQADTLESQLAQLGLSGAGLDLQAQTAGRGQNLQAASGLASIGSGLQGQDLDRLLQAFGVSGQMAQLPFQANANAIASMNAINGQHVPEADSTTQLIQLLLALSGQGEGVYNTALGNQGDFWSQFGASLPGLLDSFGKISKGRHNPNGPAGAPPAGGGGYG